MLSRLILTTLVLSLLGGAAYAASLTKISGNATLEISFNQPKEVTVAPMAAYAMLPPVTKKK